MLGGAESATLHVEKLTIERARLLAQGAQSVVGHATTELLLSGLLGFDVTHDRKTIVLGVGDELIVAQYDGPRLAPGVTELPEGARIEWYRLTIDLAQNEARHAETFSNQVEDGPERGSSKKDSAESK